MGRATSSSHPYGSVYMDPKRLRCLKFPEKGIDIATTISLQTYDLDIHLQQSWHDPRLNLRRFGVNRTVALNGAEIADKIWKPDVYFMNAKRARKHSVTMPNELVDITPSGDVYYTMR
ncbi:hypothetical protein HPB49_015371 [Dermacentor silvarum]|uniref:Uncharacterized protein n=1 Tax=Dermacentor silvarum TaxID=543639 RepID=A0ACB8CLN0_DERSI|nr:hypothetical protein HPB49_015371 [Dermacentor silvarum]